MSKAPCRLFSVLLLALAALPSSGCGPDCRAIDADRRAFLSRTPRKSAATHLELSVPFATLDSLLSRKVSQLKPVKLALPLPGTLFPNAPGSVQVVPVGLRLRPAPKDKVGLEATLEVRLARKALFRMTLGLELPVVHSPAKKLIELPIPADALRSVRPQLPANAAQSVAARIRKLLPSQLRGLINKKEVERVAGAALERLIEREFPVGGTSLLEGIGTVGRMRFTLPDLPVESLRVESTGKGGGRLTLRIKTTLPVAAGLEKPRKGWLEAYGGQAVLRVSADLVARLANQAMADGRIPDRFDDSGKPAQKGPFRPALAWVAGTRPVKLHVWRTESPCLKVRIGGTPQVKVKGKHLRVAITDGVVEETSGSIQARLAIWLQTAWSQAFVFGRKVARRTTLKVGKETLLLNLAQARREGNEFRFGIETGWKKPKVKKKK